jgi:enoyl-CoA hydratase
MIVLECLDSILVATLDRADQNTIDDQLAEAIEQALTEAERRSAVVLHLRSATPHFCGGADPARVGRWLDGDGCEALLADSRRWAQLFDRIEACPTIVMAEIRGNALGAGLGLALACDLRMASASARIGVPEARFGLLPAGSTIRRLVELGGMVNSQRLLLGGEIIDGTEAHRIGLLHRVVDDAVLETKACEWVTRVAKQSPLALREAKELLREARLGDAARTLARENLAFSRLLANDDSRARIDALLGRLAHANVAR